VEAPAARRVRHVGREQLGPHSPSMQTDEELAEPGGAVPATEGGQFRQHREQEANRSRLGGRGAASRTSESPIGV